MRFKCINAITRIKEPVWERVFSAKVFNDSKKFEKCYRQKMVSILTKYSPYYEKNMEDYDTEGEEDDAKEDKKKSGLEILKMHGIMSYAQTMEWKGPLSYRIFEKLMPYRMGVADFEEALKKTREYHLRLQLGKNCKKRTQDCLLN